MMSSEQSDDKIRVAVCFSGQLRTWRNCISSWEKLFAGIKAATGADQIDVFAHSWDFNTQPHAVLRMEDGDSNITDWLRVDHVALPSGEKEDYISRLNPLKAVFEDAEVSKIKFRQLLDQAEPDVGAHGDVELAWAASQFHSVMYAAHLKKMYEIKNKFRYDICFRMRNDLYFDAHQINWFLSEQSDDLNIPKHNTVYTCHTQTDSQQFPFRKFGDIFWYADSTTFDRICNFYRWLPIIGAKSFIQGEGLPKSTEHSLYFYSKMMGMDVRPITVDPKVFRGKDYVEQKKAAGLGNEIGGHELI